MQSQRWNEVYRLVGEVARELPRGSRRFADRVIVLVFLWAAFHHRPISWACRRAHWTPWMQRLLPRVPSPTTMSRRLRRGSVRALLDRVLERAQGPLGEPLVHVIDGTGLEVRGHSKDRQADIGYCVGRRGKGYKLHVLLTLSGAVAAWRLTPMSTSEKVMALRMLRGMPQLAYVVADGNYDSNLLHATVAQRGGQLVAPLRVSKVRRRQGRDTAGRARCAAMLEGPSPFGRDLLKSRNAIERFFGNADSHSEAMGDLPAWVRTHRRVRLWVHAKLIINAVRIRLLKKAA
jgi:hypothetical protein